MEDLALAKHDFEISKQKIKAFSEQNSANLELEKVDDKKGFGEWLGDYFLGGGIGLEHKVTGKELNKLTEALQQNLIRINNTHKKLIEEFGQVYTTFETLDTDYIQAIVATVSSVEKTSNDVQAAQERIGNIVDDLERTIMLLKQFKERLDRLSHLENIDKIWEKTEAHDAEISELMQESKHISDEVRKNAEQIAALTAYVASVSTIEHLGDVDSLWDSSQLHTAQIQGLQETEEQTQSLIQTNREDMNHALATVDEAAKTAIQELNKKINYAYMIAGGSFALALIEMLIIFLR